MIAADQQSASCEPDGAVRFICGVVSPEDLVAIPRSAWVVVSGYEGGGVHMIDTRTHRPTQVFPVAPPRIRHDQRTYGACPGPLDPEEKEKFSAHGLAVRAGPARVHTIYLVHHGFRESIEVFEVDTAPAVPDFTWVGCVVAPASAVFNSVAPVPGDGFVATNPTRRGTPPGTRGAATGEVWEWTPREGWNIVPGSASEGPNGIEASPDGRWLYVNLWPARQLMRLSRGSAAVDRTIIDVPFGPDNIHRQVDGSLLVAGFGGPSVQRVRECLRKVCDDVTSNVARVDPQTLKVAHIITYPSSPRFFSSTAALQVGQEIWIGSLVGDRIARYPAP